MIWKRKHKVICVVILDSRLYMAKACVYFAINVFSIDGLGEFYKVTSRFRGSYN